MEVLQGLRLGAAHETALPVGQGRRQAMVRPPSRGSPRHSGEEARLIIAKLPTISRLGFVRFRDTAAYCARSLHPYEYAF